MADLDTLRPEVREAAAKLDDFNSAFGTGGNWTIIRTELLRLADENKRMRGIIETLDVEGHRRAEKAEAELAALKARIAEAPITELHWLDTSWAIHPFSHELQRLVGKRVRLLVDEPQDDNAKEGRSRE